MFNWLRKWFAPTPNPYTGMFRGWKSDKFNAWSPDGEFVLWIANKFYGFADCHLRPGKRALLAHLSREERKLIFDALRDDLAQDALDILERNKIQTVRD